MSRETEVAAYLRADATLTALLPGGIYSESDMGEAGITSAESTPAVWTGGVFQPCAVVRERMPVPQYQVVDETAQLTDQAQSVEVYVYSRVPATLETAHGRIYTLVQGHRFTAAWGARWQGGVSNRRAPELPDVWMARRDYRLISIRKAA